MFENLLEFLPSLFLLIFCMISLLIVTGLKYSLKKTLFIVIPFLIVLLYANILIFNPNKIQFFDNWSVLTVFAPEFILVGFIGKRKGLSLIVAMLSAYVSFYIIVLLRNIIAIYYYRSATAIYIMYLLFVPLLFFYLFKFYRNFHNEVEKLIPKFLVVLGIYSIFIFLEFYIYSHLITITSQYVLRLEIFGVAIISVYIISLGFSSLLIKSFKSSLIKANEKDQVDKQLNAILDQYKIREEKEKELSILRHDLKHILITTSSLIKQNQYDEALNFIDDHINTIESNSIIKYCKDPIINAIICYYKALCKQNKISLKIKVKNIESALNINSSEVAILLSNCFDNAINASKKLNKNRLIEFKFINKEEKLILQIKNNYSGDIQFDKNNMPTNLKTNHGIGTQSISSFCKKHNLNLNYEINENVFILSIIF